MTINIDIVIIRGGQTGLAVSQRLARKITKQTVAESKTQGIFRKSGAHHGAGPAGALVLRTQDA